MSDETLGLPIGAVIALGSLAAGNTSNDILKWNGTEWKSEPNNFVANPLTLQSAIPAFDPALPAPAVNAGYLYKKDSLPDLFWYPDGGPEINLLTAGGGITVLGASTNHAIVRWDGVLGAAVLDSAVILNADASFSTAGSKFLQADTNNNVLLGKSALVSTLGNNNVAIGHQAGDTITLGSNNILLGSNADTDNPLRTNVVVIGANTTSVAADNSTVLRASSVRASATPYVLYYDPTVGTGTGEITYDVIPTHPDPHLLSNGTALAPTYSFSSDPNTGIYRSAADTLNITTGSSSKLQVDTNIIAQNGAVFLAPNGTALAPAYSFTSSNDTGLLYFNDGFEKLGVSINGTNVARYTSDGLNIQPAGGVDISNSNAALAINDDTRGFLPPRMTTIQRNLIPTALVDNGLTIYNIDTADLQIWNGVTWTIAGSALTNTRLIHVSTSGNNVLAAATPYNMATPFLTLEAASTTAVAGDLIIVLPGTYAVTTIAANGIAKDGVNWYFHAGADVTKATANPIFSTAGFVIGMNVYGKGTFTASVNATTYIWINAAVIATHQTFQAKSVSSSVSHIFYFTSAANVLFDVETATNTSAGAGASSCIYFGQGNDVASYVKVIAKNWTAVSSVIGGSLWYNINLEVTANLFSSSNAVTINSIYNNCYLLLNINTIIGLTYGIAMVHGGAGGSTVLNCNFCTGLNNYVHQFTLNGYIDNIVNIAAGTFQGGRFLNLTNSDGSFDSTQSFGSQTPGGGVVTVSGGVVKVKTERSSFCMGFNCTAGTLDIYGGLSNTINATTRIVNGGTVSIYDSFSMGVSGGLNGIQLLSGTLRLYCRLIAATSALIHAVHWTGGNLICNGATIEVTNSASLAIQALTPGLQLQLESGGLMVPIGTTLQQGSKRRIRVDITAAGVATTLSLNRGTTAAPIIESDTENDIVTYSTAELMATRMAALVQARASYNVIANQDTPGVDTYFYVEKVTSGEFIGMWAGVNATGVVIRELSYPIGVTGPLLINDEFNINGTLSIGNTATTGYAFPATAGVSGQGLILNSNLDLVFGGVSGGVARVVHVSKETGTNGGTGTLNDPVDEVEYGAIRAQALVAGPPAVPLGQAVLVVVWPGEYTFTNFTNTASGLMRDRINWYFHPGAVVTNTHASHAMFNSTGGSSGQNVYGHGTFIVAAGAGPDGFYSNNVAFPIVVEFDSVTTNGRYGVYCYNASGDTKVTGHQFMDAGSGNAIVSAAVACNWDISCPVITSNSAFTYTISIVGCNTYTINANTILNTNAVTGSLSINSFSATSGIINATRTNSISCAFTTVNVKFVLGFLSLNSECVVLGNATTYVNNGGRQIGGVYESIDMSTAGFAGCMEGAKLIDGVAAGTFLMSSPNKMYLEVACPSVGLGYRSTARTCTISGVDTVVRLVGDWDTTNYTWNISAGTLIIDGRYRIGPTAGNTFNLSGTGKLVLNGSIETTSTSSPIVISSVSAKFITSGKIVVNDPLIGNGPIFPSIAGINIKVMAGGLSTNYIGHVLTASRNITTGYFITSTTASMSLNDGTNGAQPVASSAPAASITAARDELVLDINTGVNSALINATAYPHATDNARFVVICNGPLDTLASTLLIGLFVSGVSTVSVGFPLGNIVGGTILQDADVE